MVAQPMSEAIEPEPMSKAIEPQPISEAIEQLRARLAELADLENTAHLLQWDQQTMMPPRGASSRAEARATLERISHEMFVSAETGRLLEAAAAALDGPAADSDEASLVRVTQRRWEKARRVPSALAGDLARAAAVGQEAWVQARADSNFAAFAPYLERNIELARRYVECFEDFDCAYDALLDDYEPGMRTAEMAALFAELKAELVPLIAKLSESSDRVDDRCLHGDFPIERQRQLVAEVVERMGFDRSAWRIDDAVHPFAVGLGASDVRITTRWDENYFASGLYGAMHECGHGLYEAGIAPALARTPLEHGESLGLHESQSRMWENMVGRGWQFSGVLAPRIDELFGVNVDQDTLYRAVNRVDPSYIRVEADEATYGLHIVLRFELEQELVEGRLAVRDLPEAWNSRFERYLGLKVPDDAHGVLQDVHWSAGLIGYFPTYALGNLIAGQLWERAHAEIPDLDQQIAAGELGALREWLREHVHRHGAKFSASELLEREMGAPIMVGPFAGYLKRKMSDVYGLDL
jgi:carboxypeptidase Taq